MIIARAPLRISFFGGGSDLPSFYRSEAGAVVSTAIDKYIYIAINRKFDNKIRASYSITEMVDSVAEVKHELIREGLKLMGIDGGIEITSISDIPSQGTGLGSSSTYTVALLHGLYTFKGKYIDSERLAAETCRIEIELCGKPIGKQDQYIAAYGGLRYIQFNPDESVFVDHVMMHSEMLEKLQSRLMLFYTGLTRSANDILAQQSRATASDSAKRAALSRMVGIASRVRDDLQNERLDSFGEALHAGWIEKKSLVAGISSKEIDTWYDRAVGAGALGGKLLGAGGGGFLLFYVPAGKRDAVVGALRELRYIPFRFEPQGSKILYYDER